MKNNRLVNIEKARNIKLILMDVDGVLTKGEIFCDASGNELKIWNVKDGLAFSIAKRMPNLDLGFITGRKSESVKKRAKNLNIKYLYMGELNKISAYNEIKKLSGLDDKNIAYIGDDLVDIPILEKVALSFCPKDSAIEIKNICDEVLDVFGGCGVFRCTLKFILSAQNRWNNIHEIFQVNSN